MSDIADIEDPKQPGNYSARTNHRWNPVAKDQPLTLLKDVDEIHNAISKFHVSPAQMYSTESGQMFHAGSVCIVICGLPARGKTSLAIGLCRYLRWLGVRANLFHFEDYRRHYKESPSSANEGTREKIRQVVIGDMQTFFDNDQGQVAIFDGVNGRSDEREDLSREMESHNVRTVFIESIVHDPKLLQSNIRDATKSPDYKGWDTDKAVEDYTALIDQFKKKYQSLHEPRLTWIRTVDFGTTILVNQLRHDFLTTKLLFYIMNVKMKSGSVYFARCSNNKLKFKSDPPLTDSGRSYIKKMYDALINHFHGRSGQGFPHDLEVWTSTRLRTIQAASIFKDAGLTVRPRPELTQLNPGAAEGLSDEELKQKFPTDYTQHQQDPYHHRYPRAESYHDLALKVEPLILEAGRVNNDVLIVADETIIRVFYGYLMASSCTDIPFMRFPTNQIIEISYNAYANKAHRIDIPGVKSD